MKQEKIVALLLVTMLIAGTFAGCGNTTDTQGQKNEKNSIVAEAESMPDVTWETEAKEGDTVEENVDNQIILSENEIKVVNDTSDIQVEDKKVTIAKPGTYEVKGSISEGLLVIDTSEKETVKLIFNGVKITNSVTAPIQILNAPKKVIISNQKGSTNIVEDGKEREKGDDSTAAIYARDDLKMSGEGTMYICGNYKKGIQSKDDLKIKNSKLYVKSEDDAIRGKDSLTIEKAYIYIDTKADGLRSTNETEDTKGNISITESELYITSKQDGIQAAKDLVIENTTSVICAGEEQTEMDQEEKKFGELQDNNVKGQKPGARQRPEDGEKMKGGQMPDDGQKPENGQQPGWEQPQKDENRTGKSSNGMKAKGTLSVVGGNHSVLRSYEGLEGEKVEIKNGTVRITASDDGINATAKDENVTPMIQMDDGYVVVDVLGDGLDSNGNIAINGGKLIVYGSERGADGALDYDGEMTAGEEATILAVGSSDMAQGITTKVNGGLEFTCDVSSEEIMSIQDEEGNVILTFKAPKAYSCVVFTSPKIKEGQSYNVYTGGENSGESVDGIYLNGQYSGGSALGTLTGK